MQYSTLGDTGLVVSRLSFGAMTFGSDPSNPSIYKVTREDAQAFVDKSLDAGVNFFDTADAYSRGQSEVMLGQALAARRRDVIIATKVGFRTGEPIAQSGLSRRHIFFSCDQSLKRLNTDHIDLYIAHREDIFTPLEETLQDLDDLVRAGKVRYLGFSNWSAWKAATALQLQKANGWARFCNGQTYYSLLGRDVEHDIVPFMRQNGIGMTVWSPLASGFLSGKYTRENLKDTDNRLSGFDFLPTDKEHGFKVVDKLRQMAGQRGASVAQIALAWLLARPVVSSVIVGTSKLSQLDDNLKAADIKLSDAEVAALDAMTKPRPVYPHWFNDQLVDPQHKQFLGPR